MMGEATSSSCYTRTQLLHTYVYPPRHATALLHQVAEAGFKDNTSTFEVRDMIRRKHITSMPNQQQLGLLHHFMQTSKSDVFCTMYSVAMS